MSAPAITDRIALFLPSLAGGGAERVFVQLANEFARLGLRIDLVLASAQGPYIGEMAATVRLVDLGAGGVMAALPKLVRYLRRERPAVMMSALDHANVIAVIASRLAGTGTRCVVSMRSVASAVFDGEGTFRSWIVLQLMKRAYPMADAIIANSQVAAADLARLLRGSGKLTTIYNPLNLEWIEKLSGEPIDHPWSHPAIPLVVSVGSLTVLKDYPTLVRAFALVRRRRDCRLVILGEGPERAKIEAVIRESGVSESVALPGFVPNPFAWLRRARVFVSSSLTEGCPNALMQALACGTRVVSTDCVGGSAEILQQGKWGRLVPTGDHAAMAEAIDAALDANGEPDVRHRAQDFAHDRIAREYLRVLLPAYAGSSTGH
jgi:glycosyltransferase involved in cell wall biosynthesis